MKPYHSLGLPNISLCVLLLAQLPFTAVNLCSVPLWNKDSSLFLSITVWILQTSNSALDFCTPDRVLTCLSVAGVGFNDKGKKTLAHPEYHMIQSMWHPTLNLGKLPADFNHKSHQRVWLCCPGCIHECGRRHEWEARGNLLTQKGHIVCPYCACGYGGFCECRSVESDPRLLREWHPSNPPANKVSKCSQKKVLWLCLEGHPPYKATCNKRCNHNSGCPVCGIEKCRTPHHPLVSVGRPDLAKEWDHKRNTKLPSQVTLGSRYKAFWACSSNPAHPPWQVAVQSRALRGTGCPACMTMNRFKPRKFGSDGA